MSDRFAAARELLISSDARRADTLAYRIDGVSVVVPQNVPRSEDSTAR